MTQAERDAAKARVAKFLKEWSRLNDRGDEIYGLHHGDEEREAVLLVSDLESILQEGHGCPDGGACHHACQPNSCFRVVHCEPLSDVYLGDEWPADVAAAFPGDGFTL